MSSLKTNDKQILEKLFQMTGSVLNFTNRTFAEFFRDNLGVDIYAEKYNYASGSKANRIRGFWMVTDDTLVSKFIIELISYIENQVLIGNLSEEDFPQKLIEKGCEIAGKLRGETQYSAANNESLITEDEFINREFRGLSLDALELDGPITNVLKQRFEEIRKCLNAKAALAVIFLCGSTLEGILLGIASKYPELFSRAKSAPAKEGKVKQFSEWTLNNFIDVAAELGIVGVDVKKFSHSLRDFRNYIHPYEQLASAFDPHDHTAQISWKVLQAAIFEIGKFVKNT